MNRDWSSDMVDAFAPLGGEDDALIELQWRDGHVVMRSQASRKPGTAAAGGVRDDEAAAWFQVQCPVEDTTEKDLFSELFGGTPADAAGKVERVAAVGGAVTTAQSWTMPPQWPAHAPREEACLGGVGISNGAAAKAAGGEDGTAAAVTGESSALTVGSSLCGSNHVPAPPGARAPGDGAPPPGSRKAGAVARDAATVTSPSMWPRPCTARTGPPGGVAAKRKQRDDTETEDVELESAAGQKLTTAKRRRAAEVHNLSERRRRDRINEKMKALQELIPHCNKTDKASMLDEAIEYLKSLQLQLQMMWMGGGMAAAAAPVTFPAGVHQYMQRVVGPSHVASMPTTQFMAPPPPVGDRCLAVDHRLPPPSAMVASVHLQLCASSMPSSVVC